MPLGMYGTWLSLLITPAMSMCIQCSDVTNSCKANKNRQKCVFHFKYEPKNIIEKIHTKFLIFIKKSFWNY